MFIADLIGHRNTDGTVHRNPDRTATEIQMELYIAVQFKDRNSMKLKMCGQNLCFARLMLFSNSNIISYWQLFGMPIIGHYIVFNWFQLVHPFVSHPHNLRLSRSKCDSVLEWPDHIEVPLFRVGTFIEKKMDLNMS